MNPPRPWPSRKDPSWGSHLPVGMVSGGVCCETLPLRSLGVCV